MNLRTERLLLLPATAELVELEIRDKDAFGQALNAEIPADWPPEQVADALPWFLQQLQSKPDLSGWLGWYGLVTRNIGQPPLLVASAGFFGFPVDGAVEVGYSVLPEFQGRGFATEMVGALVEWALSRPGVRRVAAEAKSDNRASLRVLKKLGFLPAGAGRETENLKFERIREACPV